MDGRECASRNESRPPAQTPGPLLAAAVGFALMWCGVLGLSVAFENRLFVALGAGGLILTAIAIGALDRHQIALRKLAETDPLTGLDNHGGFHLALAPGDRRGPERRHRRSRWSTSTWTTSSS